MNSRIESTLAEIGLTGNETKIYLALLEESDTTTGPIIKRTGIHASKVYEGLTRLIDKGLVNYVITGNRKHFRATRPEQLVSYLEEKKSRVDTQISDMHKILPLFAALRKETSETEVMVYHGWRGLENIYQLLRDTLNPGDENIVFGAGVGENTLQTQAFFRRHVQGLQKKKIKLRIIYNEEARGNIAESYTDKSLFSVRHLDQQTPAEINIWKNTVMIVLLEQKPTVIAITSKKIAQSFRRYFETLWKQAKK